MEGLNLLPPVNLLKSCYPSYLTPPGSPGSDTAGAFNDDGHHHLLFDCNQTAKPFQASIVHCNNQVPQLPQHRDDTYEYMELTGCCNDDDLIRMTNDFSSILNRALTPPATSLPNTPYTSPVSSRRDSPVSFIDDGVFSFEFDDEEKFHCPEMLSMDECSPQTSRAPSPHSCFLPIAQVAAQLRNVTEEEDDVEDQPIHQERSNSPVMFVPPPRHPDAINRPQRKRKVIHYINTFDLEEEPNVRCKPTIETKPTPKSVPKKKKMKKRSNVATAAAQKRDSHNVSERQRRKDLKISFNKLQDSVPDVANNQRAHTSQILEGAIFYIQHLEQEEARLRAAKNKLKKQLQRNIARSK